MDKQKNTATKKSAEPPIWLIGYNLLSGCLWSFALLNVVATYFAFGMDIHKTFQLTHWWTTAIQCLALVEIYNAATGVVRSPLLTTTMQVLSRLLVVIGVWTIVPESPANWSFAYLGVHFAWGITEVIRYYFYASNLMTQQTPAPGQERHVVPAPLSWARYNGFVVLYPVGIFCECVMIVGAARWSLAHDGMVYCVFLSVALLAYVPGAPVLFSHMLKQRAKRANTQLEKGKKKE